jgi:hypothetical protein
MAPHRPTRRDVLGLSGVALVGLAGCTTEFGHADGQDSPTPTVTEREYSHTVDSPASITVRNPEGEPAVRASDYAPEKDGFDAASQWDYEDLLVTSPKKRELLEFSPGTNRVGPAREFMTATDFDDTTLLVHQYDVGACQTRRLDRLEWDTNFSCGERDCAGIFLTYELTGLGGDCQDPDADENDGPPYSDDSHASEATFVRIPDRIQSYGRFGVQY